MLPPLITIARYSFVGFLDPLLRVKRVKRRSGHLPRYMRSLAWESTMAAIRGMHLRHVAKTVVNCYDPLHTCTKMNMFRAQCGRQGDLTDPWVARDDHPPHWRAGRVVLSSIEPLLECGP